MGLRILIYRNTLMALITLLSGLALALCLVQYVKAFPDPPATADAWVQLTSPTAPGGTVLDLAVAQGVPETIYALLRDPPGPRLFRSTDAALNWTQRYTFTQQVEKIALDPTDPTSIYASGEDGLFHSSDSGLSWTQVYTLGQVVEVVSSTLIYAGGQDGDPHCPYGDTILSRSQDGGASWQAFTLGCVGELDSLAVNSKNPQIAFAASTSEGKIGRVWRSGDGGLTWQLMNDSFWITGGIYDLAIDPQAPQHIFLSGSYGLNYSLDDGQTWQRNFALPQNSYSLAFSNNSLYAIPYWSTQSVSIYRSDDGGFTWWQTLQKLPAGVWALQATPDGELYAGPWAYGIWRSSDSGSSWQEVDSGIRSPVWVQALAADPNQPDQLYAGSDHPRPGLFQSQDGGLNWNLALTDTSTLAIAVHPITPTIIYAGGAQGLYQTTDGMHWDYVWFDQRKVQSLAFSTHAHPWLIVGGSRPADRQGFVAHYDPSSKWGWDFATLLNAAEIYAVAADPYDPDILFAAGTDGHAGKGAGIWRSQDGGHSWQEVFYQYMPEFTDLLIDAHHPGKIYASGRAGIYWSQDGGEHWEYLDTQVGSPSVYALALDNFGALYAGSETGVSRLLPGQTAWQPFGLDEPVFALVHRPGPSEVLLAGGVYSVWQRDLPPQSVWLPVIQQ